MKVRKKPVLVDAHQFREFHPWPDGVCEGLDGCDLDEPHPIGDRPHVHTLEGPLAVSEGDWIITGVAGERYPVKPDIFAATYEPDPSQDTPEGFKWLRGNGTEQG